MSQEAIEDGISIIIPAHNEAGGIGQTLEKIIDVMAASGHDHEIILVDDGSVDDTADRGAGYSDHVRIIRHDVNRGYGAALKTGLRQAKFATICITDADGTYPNEMIPVLTGKVIAGKCDMAVGARIGDNVAVPLIRRPPKWVIGHLANYVAGRNIPDVNSGLRAFPRELARRMFFILPDGFSFTSTITLTMITNDFEVEYVPVNYHKRIGRSKIRPIRDTLNFLQLITRMALYFSPLKIFMPLSGIIFLLSIFWALFGLLVWDQLPDVSVLVIALSAIQIGAVGLLAEMLRLRLPKPFPVD